MGSCAFPLLFGPYEVVGLKLKNRVVMPPMATAMEVGSDQFRCWYEARARGGVGLIIMEALSVYSLAEARFADSLAATVEAVHAHGVPVVLQLFQPSFSERGEPFAPSAGDGVREASTEELAAIPERFAAAAAQCQRVGFDGVEPHGAHGFFLNQMFSPLRNRRLDRFGGSLENRMRLGLEIVTAIRQSVGPGYPVFYRHTAEEPDGYGVEESVVFLRSLTEAGVNVLDISPSTRANVHCDIAAEVKAAVPDTPVIAVGGMQDPVQAETALATGKCDLCAVGRQLIADADWPRKIMEGRAAEVIACTQCDTRCFGNLAQGVPIGCVENPRSGNEYRLL